VDSASLPAPPSRRQRSRWWRLLPPRETTGPSTLGCVLSEHKTVKPTVVRNQGEQHLAQRISACLIVRHPPPGRSMRSSPLVEILGRPLTAEGAAWCVWPVAGACGRESGAVVPQPRPWRRGGCAALAAGPGHCLGRGSGGRAAPRPSDRLAVSGHGADRGRSASLALRCCCWSSPPEPAPSAPESLRAHRRHGPHRRAPGRRPPARQRHHPPGGHPADPMRRRKRPIVPDKSVLSVPPEFG
jgi:hypothetical protein